MDEVLWFLQSIVPTNFGMEFDKVVEVYLSCMSELRRKKLDTAGEPGDDEIPKKPFGVIESIPKPVPVRREAPDEKISKEIQAKREQRAQLATDEDFEEEDDDEPSMMDKASASRISLAATSVASSSIADSPRNLQRPLSSISNVSYVSAVQDSATLERSTPLKMNGVAHPKPAEELPKLSAKESFMQTSPQAASTPRDQFLSYHGAKDDPPNGEAHDDFETQKSFEKRQYTGSLSRKGTRASPSPPPPPPRSANSTSTFISHEQTVTTSFSSSVFEYSSLETGGMRLEGSLGRKKDPPPVSPRKITIASSTSPQSSSGRSFTSVDSSISSVSIPHGGEAVRIHVPYLNDSQTFQGEGGRSSLNSTSSPRNGIDISRNKNDPNRIKIEISANPQRP